MRSSADATSRRDSARGLWAASDAILLDAGVKGELVIAQIRLLLTLMLLLIPLITFLRSADARESMVGLCIISTAVGIALLVYIAVRRDLYRSWIPFATTVMDVSLVSAALATFLVLGQPHTAVNSRVIFEAYFIAIAATSLRYDVRTCVVGGVLAVTQYAAIVVYADSHYDLNNVVYTPFTYGHFDWATQLSRLVLLGIAGVLSGAIVVRAQELRRLSAIDRMTGLFNRGYFDERVAAEVSRARRSSQPISLVMLDVDHFKLFNDKYGHAAGDAGLRAIASLLRHTVRRSDIVERYGGEEFVLVLPDTSAEAAVEKVEAIRSALEQTAIRLPREQGTGALTISAGVATFPADGVTSDELLDEADARLFKAKESGRNLVVGRMPTDPPPPRQRPSPPPLRRERV